MQNTPNPFSRSTTFNFYLPVRKDIELSIYNLLGEKIAVVISGQFEPGNHSIGYDSKDLNSGTYYYRLETNTYSKTLKMIIID